MIDRLRATFADVPEQYRPVLLRIDRELTQCPDPALALTSFERLFSSVIDKQALYRTLHDFPPIIARLIRLFISSSYLSEILFRDFQFLYLLITPDRDAKPLSESALSRTIDRILRHASFSTAGKLNALRQLKERELLKIGIQDYVLGVPLQTTIQTISVLADRVADAVSRITFDEIKAKLGEPQTAYCIIALGKLGGRELNYSSDIDVMFIYGDEGKLDSVSYHEFFCRHATTVIKHLSEPSNAGTLYRTDARLRPDGESGPLARSAQGCRYYYESRGRLWERQMLIKARIISGDFEFGRQFLESLNPFVYPKTFFQSPMQDIARMKWRIEEQKQKSGQLNIKVDPGGIRDIEFIAQALQLINGGANPDLRTGSTLAAIDKLRTAGYLAPEESDTLARSYILFRRIEHLLQVQSFTQTHSLSGSETEAERIAFLLNEKDAAAFNKRLRQNMSDVRSIYDSVFGTTEISSPFSLLADSLNESSQKKLEAVGIISPETAHQLLRSMSRGRFPRMNTGADAKAFEALLPLLLEAISRVPNPDHTLTNLERILSGYPFPETIYKYLAGHKEYFDALVSLASLAHPMTNVLCEKPNLLDRLMTRVPEWRKETLSNTRSDFKSVFDYKNIEFIRLILQHEWNLLDLEALQAATTALAEQLVNSAYAEIFDPEDEFIIIGMGKLGGRELGLKSDLDLVFVCGDDADVNRMIEKCRLFLGSISSVTSAGKLYDADARLRPDGKNAPLVVPEGAYDAYYRKRAMFWERQALVRARPLAGPSGLRQRMAMKIREIVYDRPLPDKWPLLIAEMRKKQIAEKIRTSEDATLELKYSRGGLTDLEYAMQALQLKLGRDNEDIRDPVPFADWMRKVVAHGTLDEETANASLGAYNFFRQVEHYHFIVFDRKSTRLPHDEKQLALLANFCKIYNKELFMSRLSETRTFSEKFFDTIEKFK